MSLSERLLRELSAQEYIRELLYTSLVISLLVSIAHLVLYCMKACRVGTGSKMGGLSSRSMDCSKVQQSMTTRTIYYFHTKQSWPKALAMALALEVVRAR